MKNAVAVLLFLVVFLSGFSQKKMEPWKKSVLIGTGMTVGGVAALTGSALMMPRGFLILEDAEGGPELATGIGMVAGGCILLAGGITLTVAGPIILAHGVKSHKKPKGETETISMIFKPLQNPLLDKYQNSLNQKKFASLSFTF